MNWLLARMRRDERGAALILALAFLLVIGGIGAAVLTSVTSGLNDRGVLKSVRDREYAADGAVEGAITQVRTNVTNGATDPCSSLTQPAALDSVQIHVDCTFSTPLLLSGLVDRDAVFTAKCASVQPECPDINFVILRAQVNFASTSAIGAASVVVSKTYIQSWSVNG